MHFWHNLAEQNYSSRIQ